MSDQTQGEIPMLFGQGSIDTGTRSVLADAVYFHGDWQTPFAPKSPDGTFHAATGDGVSVGVTGLPQRSLVVDRPFLFVVVH